MLTSVHPETGDFQMLSDLSLDQLTLIRAKYGFQALLETETGRVSGN